MYRVIPHKFLFLAVAWLVFGLTSLLMSIDGIIRAEWLRPSLAITIAWAVVSLAAFNPVWRWFWKRFPALGRHIYPDLNGVWDVEMLSNWPIHRQVIDAAAGRGNSLDVERCDGGDLAGLQRIALKAEIEQTWFKIEIVMWNPAGDTPIDRSEVIVAEPVRAEGLRPAGLFYFFKQKNRTNNLADDTEFYGAARVEYDRKTDTLAGGFWTERMWDRAMNTAGRLTFRRSADAND